MEINLAATRSGAVKKNVGDIHGRTGCTGRPVCVPTRSRFENYFLAETHTTDIYFI